MRYISRSNVKVKFNQFFFIGRRTFARYDFVSSSDEEEDEGVGIIKKKHKSLYKKKVRYYDLMPGDVMLPTPVPVIKHTASDTSILRVGQTFVSYNISDEPMKLNILVFFRIDNEN